ESGKLIDKLSAFVTDMSAIGDSLDKARKNYDSAMGKLRDGKGNILSRADKIAKLGAKATRQLPANGESDE
ncbi:MAG: DNA recombination protein RmuC, partial [Muribaculaceae bacterium]